MKKIKASNIMAKNAFFTHVLSNIIIIAVIGILYIGCIQPQGSAAVSAPIYKGDTSQKQVSLMINVYWGTEYIEDMLEVLRAYNAKCTFFVGGSWCASNPEMLQLIAREHEIGNHGYFHKDHKNLNKKQNSDEIIMCEKQVEKIAGIKTILFAPPSGSIGNVMLDVCNELNYKVIMWSKDTIDWRDKDYQLVFKRATTNLSNGDLILMHPTEHTLKALPMILQHYKTAGYNAVKVSDIIANKNLATA